MQPPRSLPVAAPPGGSCSGPAEPDPRKRLDARGLRHAGREVSAPRPVRVHIERVAIEGLAMTPAQSRQFSAALSGELQLLARHPGWPAGATSQALPGALAPAVSAATGASPSALGREVARSVFSALRGLR